MPFQQSNYNGNNMNNGGEKKKTNFRVGRIYGGDGIMDVSIWKSDSATYAILQIKQAIGKDPSTGRDSYEQKAPNELPRMFLNSEGVRALYDFCKDTDPTTMHATLDPGRGTKITLDGSPANVKITIEDQKKGTRSITLNATPIGGRNIHATWNNFLSMLQQCVNKSVFAKLDPEEFGQNAGDEETPF